MKKEMYFYSAATIMAMLVFICMAFLQRMNWKEKPINESTLENYPIMGTVNYSTKPIIPALNELINNSQTIVKVKGTDTHELQEFSVLSKVQVLNVYKGDKSLEGKSIFIYEPFVISNAYVTSDGGYMLMQPGSEYILFLDFFKQPDGYKYSDKDIRTYLLSELYWSKYSLFVEEDTKVYNPNTETGDYLLYKQVKGYDFLIDSQQDLDNYENLHNQVLEWVKTR